MVFLLNTSAIAQRNLYKNLSLRFDYNIFYSNKNGKSVDNVLIEVYKKGTWVNAYRYELPINANKLRSSLKQLNDKDLFHTFTLNKKSKHISSNNDHGNIVVGDFNFDKYEDFAVKVAETEYGSQYAFFTTKGMNYELNELLTNHLQYIPNINPKNRTLESTFFEGKPSNKKILFKLDTQQLWHINIMD